MIRSCAVLTAIGAAALGCATGASASSHPRALLARTPSGHAPDGRAGDPAISGDGRVARWASFSSTATDIVRGAGEHRNVFLVERKAPYSTRGTPWSPRRTLLASPGRGGPADGDSWGGAFDGFRYDRGDRTIPAKCFAFVSAASNLVPGDTDGAPDVFVRTLATGRLRRIASSRGASEVDLDGFCTRVAFVAGGEVEVASADGRGGARRVSGPGASSVELSVNAKTATFERGGAVWVWQRGRTRRLVSGSEPSADAFGRYVTYRRGRDLFRASMVGGLAEQPLRASTGALVHTTTAPSMTAGGRFILFGAGRSVDSNAYRRFAVCPGAGATVAQVAGSAHGNYAVYSCSTGDVWISNLGRS